MLKLATEDQVRLYNEQIYPLQDEVFKLIQSRKFYLTGGTCLSRFYYQHRYSDDLDFFFDGSKYLINDFETEFRLIHRRIGSQFKLNLNVDSEYFKQLLIETNQCNLKIDFVFEPISYIGTRKSLELFDIDTKENIVANKLTTIYNRKTYKDYIDLYYLMKEYDLEQVIKWADEKMVALDYESAVLALVDGSLRGDVFLIKKINDDDFLKFIKDLTNNLLGYARTVL